jgi:D-xylose 1-dehydrogenase (NADP+, D-xylono-1,5-lactone-forming)
MINWGFLGAGWVATRALAPAVHEARNAKLLGVASRDLGRAAALVPEKTYDKYEDLLADSEIDAVYINLANHQHCEWTIAALAAGKHVLCEKPLALNYEQGQMMAKAAAKYDRILVEAVWNRWHPRFARIVELVNGGDIGAINRIDSSFC